MLSLLAAAAPLHAQATTTASKRADAQIGVGFVNASPDYAPQRFSGIGVYGDLDLARHLGLEAEFHQAGTSSGYRSYERTYEIGGRYFRTYGPLVPYVKVMVGRGVFDYPEGTADIAYNMFAAGGGADYKIGRFLRVRGEYEFQKWSSFPTGGLTPQLLTFGVAYHFDGKPRYD